MFKVLTGMVESILKFLPSQRSVSRLIACFLFILTYSNALSKELIVRGEDDGLPIAGATLLSGSGHIIGITDSHGKVDLPENASFPVTLRSMGYDILTLSAPSDTVSLIPANYSLPEVEILANERPVRRVLWYAREYSTGSTGRDTMQLYSEYMLESFFTDNKVKGFRSSDSNLSSKSVRRYARISGKNRTDSVFMPKPGDDITTIAWGETFFTLPEGYIKETPAISEGATLDSIAGKYATKLVLKKSRNRYTRIADNLSDSKDHSMSPTLFKLFGMTIDINQYNSMLCFQQNEQGLYNLYDLLYSSVTLDVLARGKVFRWIFKSKEPLRMNTYIELYPVEITSHSIDEYKKLRKSYDPVAFKTSENMLPEIPAVTELKNRFTDR